MGAKPKYSSRLKSIRASYWAFSYLALIPIYAAIYYFLIPNQFYHSTVQYEQSINEDAINILGRLKDEITTKFREKYNADETTVYGWVINVNSIKPYALKVNGDEVSFRLGYQLKRLDGSQANDSPTLKYLFSERMASFDPDKNEWVEMKLIHAEGLLPLPFFPDAGKKEDVLKAVLPYGEERGIAPGLIILPLSGRLDAEIRNFASGTRGFPSKSSGHFVRMLYLSAITITTVGYGDILPITTTARALVSSEAVLGIILIGLFLNSLWYEKKYSDDVST